MENNVKAFMERLDKAADSIGMSVMRLQTELGYSNSYFRNMGRINYDASLRLKKKFPQLNVEWINTGEGEMSTETAVEVESVPLLPISAHGGKLSDFEDSVAGYECERVISPVKGATLAVPVTGDSMSPEYPSGSKVFIKKIDDSAFIDWGRTYVLDTVNGIVIKNLYPCADNDKVLCRSINANYPDFEIAKESIRAMYRVLMMMTLK